MRDGMYLRFILLFSFQCGLLTQEKKNQQRGVRLCWWAARVYVHLINVKVKLMSLQLISQFRGMSWKDVISTIDGSLLASAGSQWFSDRAPISDWAATVFFGCISLKIWQNFWQILHKIKIYPKRGWKKKTFNVTAGKFKPQFYLDFLSPKKSDAYSKATEHFFGWNEKKKTTSTHIFPPKMYWLMWKMPRGSNHFLCRNKSNLPHCQCVWSIPCILTWSLCRHNADSGMESS